MRIAITGGTGFLGKYVIDSIKNENNIPIILARSKIGSNINDCEYRITDYSKSDLVEKLFDIDAVVHLAAKRGGQEKISRFHDIEILTQNLYEACYEGNITNIVYASTISVYSDQKLLPWIEVSLPRPESMYGVSKLACEYIGNIYSEIKGLKIKNLRFAHLYGFNEKNNYMINRFFRRAFHHEQLALYAKGVARREFLYAKDAAKAIACALNKKKLSGTFNLGSGEALTNYEVADIINTKFKNKDNLIIEDPNGDEGVHSSYMDSTIAKRELRFSTDYTFEDAVEEIYELMKVLDHVPLFY